MRRTLEVIIPIFPAEDKSHTIIVSIIEDHLSNEVSVLSAKDSITSCECVVSLRIGHPEIDSDHITMRSAHRAPKGIGLLANMAVALNNPSA